MHDLRDFTALDSKTAAKRLRSALKDRKIDLSHGECLDLVAQMHGLRNWNLLSARLAESSPAALRLEAPSGWVLGGANLAAYIGGLDREQKHLGKPVFWLQNSVTENGHATLLQTLNARDYRTKRLCFSGWMRTENVNGVASMFMRADDDKGRYVALRTLEHLKAKGALRGTEDWSQRAIVLDIPADAHTVTYGFTLARGGAAWFCGFDVRGVGTDIPVTVPEEMDAPLNLDFTAA